MLIIQLPMFSDKTKRDSRAVSPYSEPLRVPFMRLDCPCLYIKTKTVRGSNNFNYMRIQGHYSKIGG
jgi:hypothetical protein